MGRRRRNWSVNVDVDIDLDTIDEDDLVGYLKDCGYAVIKGAGGIGTETLTEIYEAVRDGRRADALAVLERVMWPKWRSPADCQAELDNILSIPAALR